MAAPARKVLLIDDDRMQFRLTQAHFKNFRGEHYDLDWASTYEDGAGIGTIGVITGRK